MHSQPRSTSSMPPLSDPVGGDAARGPGLQRDLLARSARPPRATRAQARLFDLVWSDELLGETKRVLIERKPTSEAVAERWVSYLRDAFPDGRVDITDLPADVE